MRFNKTTEYAFRIFAYMAASGIQVFLADEIYEQLRIPKRYLKRLLTQLSKTDLMESIQGNKGGYKLIKAPDEIALLDIVNVTESAKEKHQCFFGFQECQFGKECHLHNNWTIIVEDIEKLLATTTLTDLTDKETQQHIIPKIQLLTKNH